MSSDTIDGGGSIEAEEISRQKCLPAPYQKAILKCASCAMNQKEFRDMTYGIYLLGECMSKEYTSKNFGPLINEMVTDLCRHIPED
ncbi:MAG: hypothetical protein WC936_04625 [Candidatus Nanoarchaeia archaeon]|jgi:hypothetical protein